MYQSSEWQMAHGAVEGSYVFYFNQTPFECADSTQGITHVQNFQK
jgi:hypothetical protein